MTPKERVQQLKDKFASYGSTISTAERNEFNLLCDAAIDAIPSDQLPLIVQKLDELKAAVALIPTAPTPPPAPPPPVNQAPVANAGPDAAVTLPSTLTLTPSYSDDGLPAGSVPTTSWAKVSGPGTVTFSGNTATFSVDGTYTLRFTVSDGALSGSDDVIVTVNPVVVQPPASKIPLVPSDFTYLGYYDIQTSGAVETVYGSGLTHRYVNGDLRFITMTYGDGLHEFSIAGKSYGNLINTPTNKWTNIGGLMDYRSFWWDEPKQRLWSTTAVDYTPNYVETQVFTRTLNANGTVSNLHGPVSLSGISAKRAFGGACAVPQWFQTQYNVGPYAIGWGGYTSLVASGGNASMGPTMFIMPDPANYANNTIIPVGSFTTVMDNGPTGSNPDWYANGAPTSYDRGNRITHPINYFDDPARNGNLSTPPTAKPSTGAGWLSSQPASALYGADGRGAPDGIGRFIPGDSYFNTGCWIDGTNKHGFVAVASLCKGRGYYMSSDLHYDNRQFELHIWNPADLGAAVNKQKPTWNVKPSSMVELNLPGAGAASNTSSAPISEAGGATYDPISKRLYIMYFGGDPNGQPLYDRNRLYVYQVNS